MRLLKDNSAVLSRRGCGAQQKGGIFLGYRRHIPGKPYSQIKAVTSPISIRQQNVTFYDANAGNNKKITGQQLMASSNRTEPVSGSVAVRTAGMAGSITRSWS